MQINDENILVDLNQVLLHLIDGKIEPAIDLLDKLDLGLIKKNHWSEIAANCRKYINQYEEGVVFLNALANGNLNVAPPEDPMRNNCMISHYKQLHSSLSHLTWQTQQIAKGDLNQKITFLGELSVSYNNLIQTLREMRQLEERLRLATNAGKIGIWDWDIVNNILIWDDSMYYLYGIRKEDFGGAYDAWSKTLHPDDRKFTEGEIQAAIRGEQEYSPEFRIITADGSVKIIKAESKTIYDQSGKALRMTGTNIDITIQKQAEDKLLNSEHNLAEAERIGKTGSWDYDVASGFASWSENMFRIFDVDREMPGELIFKYFVENLVHPDDRTQVLSIFRDTLAGKRPYDTEFRIFMIDGGIRIIHMMAETQCDEQGKVIRLAGKVEDITDRKQAEYKVSEQLDELKRWYDATADREDRILEVKQEVNELLIQAGKPPRYESAT